MTAVCDKNEQQTIVTNHNNNYEGRRCMTKVCDGDERQMSATNNNNDDDNESQKRMTEVRDDYKQRWQTKVTNEGDNYWQQKKMAIDSYRRWKKTAINDAEFVSAKLWLIFMFLIAVFK